MVAQYLKSTGFDPDCCH